jgi:hypothetical protein
VPITGLRGDDARRGTCVRSDFELTFFGLVLSGLLEAYGRRPRNPRSLRFLFDLTRIASLRVAR